MSKKYDEYLKEHKHNVSLAYMWLCANTPDIIKKCGNETNITLQICKDHDKSKYQEDEYIAYDKYFYPEEYDDNKYADVKLDFYTAWLKHIHKNPHHWQHWVLVNGDGNIIALDMPYNYIVEMICDWWSFSFRSDNLRDIFDWYDSHSNNMMISYNTRTIIEQIFDEIKKVLDK